MSMPGANNANELSHVLRVGWCGAACEFAAFQSALDGCDELELATAAAVAEPADAAAGTRPALHWSSGRVFDNPAEMIETADIQAVVLSCPLPDALTLTRAALQRNMHVWRRAPLGRDLAEAVACARQMREAPVVAQIGSWWNAVREMFPSLVHSAEENGVCELRVNAPPPQVASWRCIRSEAGGGVLIQDAYDLLEAMIDQNGMPEAVYAAVNRANRDASRPARDVEDWAAAVFRYAGRSAGTLTCSWNATAFDSGLFRHTTSGSVLIEKAGIRAIDHAGALREEMILPHDLLPMQMKTFAAAIHNEDRRKESIRSLQRHVATSAVIEAIYLSARTSQPESPRTLCELHRWQEPQS